MPIKKTHKTDEEPEEEYLQDALFEEEDDDDDAGVEADIAPALKGGMAALEKALLERKSSTDDYFFKFTEEGTLVLFLSDGPLHIYNIHWVDMPQEDGKTAPRSFVCTETNGMCPLCAVGVKSRFVTDWPVLQLIAEGDDLVESKRIMSVGPGASRELVEIDHDRRKGPLLGHWYFAKRTGKGYDTRYSFEFVKRRDLEDDYDVPEEGARGLEDQYLGKDFDWYKAPSADRDAIREAASVVKKAV